MTEIIIVVAGIRIGLIPLGYEPNVQTTTPTHDIWAFRYSHKDLPVLT